ncbi:MAG: YfcE family phosphodiesterase [Phycisphaerales bacterium JB043]
MADGLVEASLEGSVLGLLSDSHAERERTARAIDLLVSLGADAIVHLGDVCSEGVLDAMAGAPVALRFVWGNMDEGLGAQERYARSLGMQCDHPAGLYTMCQQRLVATHGHMAWVERQAREIGADYLLHGHTHTVRDESVDGLRVLNPGALHRANRYTVGVLALESGRFDIHEVD